MENKYRYFLIGFDSQTQRNTIEEVMALNEGAGTSSCTYSTENVSYSMEENEEAEGKNENVFLCLSQILCMSCN